MRRSPENLALVEARRLAAQNTPEAVQRRLALYVQQNVLDAAAQARGYDSIHTAVTYAEEDAVPQFQAEGQAYRAWRSQVWAKCYEVLAEVQAGTRPIPTENELAAELPELVLP